MRAREKETLSKLFDLHDMTSAQLAERMTALEQGLASHADQLNKNITRETERVREAIPPATVLHQAIADTVRHQHQNTRTEVTERVRKWGEHLVGQINAKGGRSGETFFLGVVVGAAAVIITLAFTGHVG